MVLEIDSMQEATTESKTNLFQDVQIGCKPVKLDFVKIHESKSQSSQFSNACDKLGLTKPVAHHAWIVFIKLQKVQQMRDAIARGQNIVFDLSSNFTNHNFHSAQKIPACNIPGVSNELYKITRTKKLSSGSIAMFSLFISCRKFGISKSESQLSSAVKLAFSLKRLPGLLKIFSDIKPIAIELNINSDGDHLEYYLNYNLKKQYLSKFKRIRMTDIMYSGLKEKARKIAHALPGTTESRARNAVKFVLLGCNDV
jgi:hypothetical protein